MLIHKNPAPGLFPTLNRLVNNTRGIAMLGLLLISIAVPGVMLAVSEMGRLVKDAERTTKSSQTKQTMNMIRDYLINNARDIDSNGQPDVPKEGTDNSLPASLPFSGTDMFGTAYLYCTWHVGPGSNTNAAYSQNNTTPPKTGLIAKLVSAGADKTFQTSCDDVNANGDDITYETFNTSTTFVNNGWTAGAGNIFATGMSDMIGIGTNTPPSRVTIYDSANISDAQQQIRIGVGANRDYTVGRMSASGLMKFAGSEAGTAGYLFEANGIERFKITPTNGNAQFGAPGADTGERVQVAGVIKTTDGTKMSKFGADVIAVGAVGIGSTTNHDFVVGANGTEVIRASVDGTTMLSKSADSPVFGATGNLVIANPTGSQSQIQFTHAGTTNGTIRSDSSGNLVLNSRSGAIYLNNDSGVSAQIFSPGNTIVLPASAGIGTAAGAFNLNVNGSTNTGTLYVAGNLLSDANRNVIVNSVDSAAGYKIRDTRAVNDAVGANPAAASFDMKQNAVIGNAGAGAYSTVMTLTPWVDDSAGGSHQIAYSQDGNIYNRYGTRAGGWGAWRRNITSGDVNGTVSYIPRFTSANSVGDSSISDDGSGHVSINSVGANRQNLQIKSAGTASAFNDVIHIASDTSSLAASAPFSWNLSYRKDGYFSESPAGSYEFYGANSVGYYAPLAFKADGDVILASPRNTIRSGNVIIGATSPYNSTTDKLTVLQQQNAATRIVIDNQDSGASASAGLALQAYGGSWQIRNHSSGTFTNPLTFDFNGSEKVRITSDGSIIATGPNSFNSTATGGNWGFMQGNYVAGQGGDVYNRGFSAGAIGIMNASVTAQDVYLYNQNSPAAGFLVLKDTGNVGIGTTAPAAALHVANSAIWTTNGWDRVSVFGRSGISPAIQLGYGSGTRWGMGVSGGSLYMFTADGDTSSSVLNYRAMFDSTGNISLGGSNASSAPTLFVGTSGSAGVGTVSPTTKFEVIAGSDGSQILWGQTIRNTANANNSGYGSGLRLSNSQGGGVEANKWSGLASVASLAWSNKTDLAIYTNGDAAGAPTEKVRITGDGNMGIGNTSPVTKLDVVDSDSVNRTTYRDVITVSAKASTAPYTGHGGGILFAGSNYQNNNGTIPYARIGSTINSDSINTYGSDLFFDVAPTSAGGLQRAMTIKYNGNVGIGTTPAAKLHVYGGGQIIETSGNNSTGQTITLMPTGATQANLGTYPGTWSPALQMQTNTGRYLWMSPLYNDSGTNPRLSSSHGFDLYVNGQNTLKAMTVDTSGNATFAGALSTTNSLYANGALYAAYGTSGQTSIYNQVGEGAEIILGGANGVRHYLENINGTFRGINSARTAAIWSFDQGGNMWTGGNITAAGSGTFTGVSAGGYSVNAGDGLGLAFWANSPTTFGIMMSHYSVGGAGQINPTNEYNMYFSMKGGGGRGFVFNTDNGNVTHIDGGGQLFTKGAIFPGWNNGTLNAQTSYYLQGNSAGGGLSTNGNFKAAGDLVGAALSFPGGFRMRDLGASGYAEVNNWIHLAGNHGLYSVNNGAHISPNTGTYGAWAINGTRNGWGGFEFTNANASLMANNRYFGYYQYGHGWWFRVDDSGHITNTGAYFPGHNNGALGEQSSYYLYGNTENSGIRTNGNFLANADIYLGARAAWLSGWLNQPVLTTSSPTFASVYTSNWFRSTGNSGWYNENYHTGIWSTEEGIIDIYNSARVRSVRNNAAINNASYEQGNMELRTTDGSNPILGFHRGGSSAGALYHSGYGTGSLRYRGADGVDGQVMINGVGETNYFVQGVNDTRTSELPNPNAWLPSGFYNAQNHGTNLPYSSYWSMINVRHTNGGNNYGMQILGNFFNQGDLYYRIQTADSFQGGWGRIWTQHNSPIIGYIGIGNANSLRHTSPDGYGYIEIGAQNTSWAHIQTDRPAFYFNKGIAVDGGGIGLYNGNWSISSTGTVSSSGTGYHYAANYFYSNMGSGAYLGSSSGPGLQAYSTDGGAAFMSFHRSGAYAVNMGLDPDNVFRIGGWSAPSARMSLDMAGNLTTAGNISSSGNISAAGTITATGTITGSKLYNAVYN